MEWKSKRLLILLISVLLGTCGCQPAKAKETVEETTAAQKVYRVEAFGVEKPDQYGVLKWNLRPGVMKKEKLENLEAGQAIEVNVSVTPENQPVQVGLLAPNGTKEYITITEGEIHNFYTQMNGDYYLYAESENAASVAGMYWIKNYNLGEIEIEHHDITSEPIEGLTNDLVGEYLYAEPGVDAAEQYVIQKWLHEPEWSGSSRLLEDYYNIYGFCDEHYVWKDREVVFSCKNIHEPETTYLTMKARRENGTLFIEIERDKVPLGEETRNEIYAHFSHPWSFFDMEVYLDGVQVSRASWAPRQ